MPPPREWVSRDPETDNYILSDGSIVTAWYVRCARIPRQQLTFDGATTHKCHFEVAGRNRDLLFERRLKQRPNARDTLAVAHKKFPRERFDTIYWVEVRTYFRECRMCGKPFEGGSSNYLCDECNEQYVRCEYCRQYVRRDEVDYDRNDHAICRQCHSGTAGICEECGNWSEWLSDDDYCEDCDRECGSRGIHEHGWRPSPLRFLPELSPDSLYMGIELETDNYGSSSIRTAAEALKEISDGEKLFWLQDDGSLANGIEIVSHPATLEYHKESIPWKKMMEIVKGNGGESHETDTCGLHIHFNSTFFGDCDSKEHDRDTAKLLYLFETFWAEMKKFSRRTEHNLAHWAQRYSETPTPDLAKRGKSGQLGRYHAINLCNHATIEIRLFRGTLKSETFYATLEFVDFLARLVKNYAMVCLRKLTWGDLVELISKRKYEYLLDYLEERGLADVSDNI